MQTQYRLKVAQPQARFIPGPGGLVEGTRSANNSIQIPIARRAMEEPTEQPKRVFKGWQDVRTVFRSISEIGFKETFKTAKKAALLRWEFWSGHRFDRKFNVDTTRLAFPQDLTLKGGSADFSRFYMATSIRVLRSAFSILPKDLSEFVFMDLGSGKGRTLLIASEYNFKKIIGVECAQELHEIAKKQIAHYKNKKQKCFDIESVCENASTSTIPNEKCVFYFYNTFAGRVFLQTFSNIKRSYLENRRKMYFIFYNLDPDCASVFEELGIAKRVQARRFRSWLGLPKPYPLAVYETAP
jgi:SAM-dependent methyltransferase